MSKLSIILLTVFLSQHLHAEDTAEIKGTYVLCASVNGIIAAKMKTGVVADFIKHEAKRNADQARILGASDNDFDQVLQGIQAAYNEGKISWEELTSFGKECAQLP